MSVPPDQPNPESGQPYPGPGQPYPPAGQPYPPAGQPYPPAGQPYPPTGQNPTGGQPYPGAGQPYPPSGQPYPAPGQPYPPAPGNPAPGGGKNFFKSVVGRLLVVLVVVGLGIGFWAWQRSGTVATAEVGDCFSATGSPSNPDGKVSDCADDAANYVVTQTAASAAISCDPFEISFTLTASRGSDASVCLRPNLETGDCWNEPMGDAIPSVIPCGEAGDYTLKVTGVVLDTTDLTACPEGTMYPAVIEKRSVVYCFTDPS